MTSKTSRLTRVIARLFSPLEPQRVILETPSWLAREAQLQQRRGNARKALKDSESDSPAAPSPAAPTAFNSQFGIRMTEDGKFSCTKLDESAPVIKIQNHHPAAAKAVSDIATELSIQELTQPTDEQISEAAFHHITAYYFAANRSLILLYEAALHPASRESYERLTEAAAQAQQSLAELADEARATMTLHERTPTGQFHRPRAESAQ